RFPPGLGRGIEPAAVPFTNTSVEWHLFDDLTYDLSHTLPFVCDQVLTYPRDTRIMVVGSRADFVACFAAAWHGMGFSRPILVPQECRLGLDDPAIEIGRFADQLRRTDLFLFEFGLV